MIENEVSHVFYGLDVIKDTNEHEVTFISQHDLFSIILLSFIKIML